MTTKYLIVAATLKLTITHQSRGAWDEESEAVPELQNLHLFVVRSGDSYKEAQDAMSLPRGEHDHLQIVEVDL